MLLDRHQTSETIASGVPSPTVNNRREFTDEDEEFWRMTGLNKKIDDVSDQTTGRVPLRKLSLAFSKINFETTKGKTLLSDVSGYVGAGEMCGILGPSGSGKTCLLDVLAMRRKNGGLLKDGEVLYGGRPLKARSKGDSMCYVAQEDVLLPALTVKETVTFAVRLEYGYSISKSALNKLVYAILDDTGLRSSADVMVSTPTSGKGISGGQRRRLMIAVELVSCPAVMILDEPTSGLDFASAYGVMKELKILASNGHTVVCVIHSPSSQIWALFDKVGFISQGSLVYFGATAGLLPYFEALGHNCPEFYNPAEFIMELLNPVTDMEVSEKDSLRDAFEKSSLLADVHSKISEEKTAASKVRDSKYDTNGTAVLLDDENGSAAKPTHVGLFESSAVLLHRNMLDLFRNPSLLLARLLLIALMAVLMGLTFFRVGDRFNDESIRSRSSALFFLPSFTSLVCMSMIPYFMNNRAVIKKEIGNGRYSVWAYALSFIVPMLISSSVIAISTTLISFFMMGFRNFGEYFLAMLANFAFIEILVLAAAAIVNHYLVGMLLVIAVVSSGMATQGYFIMFNRISWAVRWIGYVTPNRYMFRAFMRNEFQDMGNLTSVFYPTGVDYLNFYGFDQEDVQSFWADMAIVGAFIAFAFMCFLAALSTWAK